MRRCDEADFVKPTGGEDVKVGPGTLTVAEPGGHFGEPSSQMDRPGESATALALASRILNRRPL